MRLGVDIFDSSNDRIGGTTAPERNVVSGNTQNGVDIEGNPPRRTTSSRGTTSGPRQAAIEILANGGAGISIAAPATTIGGTTPGAGNAISGNNGGAGSHDQANPTPSSRGTRSDRTRH